MSTQTKFKGFKSLAEVKEQYAVSKLEIKVIKKDDSEYKAVFAGEKIVALTANELDVTKPMTFGIGDDDRLRLINYDPSKRVELATLHTI